MVNWNGGQPYEEVGGGGYRPLDPPPPEWHQWQGICSVAWCHLIHLLSAQTRQSTGGAQLQPLTPPPTPQKGQTVAGLHHICTQFSAQNFFGICGGGANFGFTPSVSPQNAQNFMGNPNM